MRKIVMMIMLVICGFALGMKVGIQTEKKKIGKWFVNEAVKSSTSNVNTRIKAMKLIKNGEVDKAEDCLDSVVDVELAYLATTVKDASPLLGDKQRVVEAIQQVKEFRGKYPGHQVKPDLKDSVTAALNLATK